MMRQTTLISTTVAIVLASAAALAAHADEQSFSFTDFDGIDASAGVDVVLQQGAYDIRAEGSERALERLEIKKRGDTLHIGRKSRSGWSWGSSDKVTVTVSAPDYSAISASSGSDVAGANLQFSDVAVSVSSGADIELAGSCDALTVSVSSGSNFDGERLQCQTVSASASSGADADVWAARSLVGEASSGGDIKVYGDPQTITRDTSSGGSVRKS